MEKLVEIQHLKKTYQDREVLHGISFNILSGEILSFLGPNGAGKSTMIQILSGVLSYDSGKLLFKRQPIQSNLQTFKSKLGVVPQDLAIYEELTAEQNVRFFASLYGLKKEKLDEGVTFALESVALWEHRKEKAKTFSGGMKRRLNIACAIAHRPMLLIMDEPTVGIDPQSRNHILESVKKMNQEGMTILYTTHYMEEVETISDRVIIMDHGKMIAEGSVEELKSSVSHQTIVIKISSPETLNLHSFYEIPGVEEAEVQGQKLVITTIQSVDNLDKLIEKVLQQQQKIHNIEILSSNLETVFLDLTGRTLRD